MHRRPWVAVAAVFLACLSSSLNDAGFSLTAPLVAAEPRADDLLIVDCLLPGQMRRLGTQMTYVTARRAVKTTAAKCAIQGGEYTAADRADFRTALQTWLPLAKEGNPEAQTYLGEIYEKGLGVPAQYDLALEWYRKAADQGFSRAQLNIGALYENGLGVPQDKAQAVAWYRRASGLEGSAVPFVPGPSEAEVQALRQERESLAKEREDIARDRDSLRRELDTVRGQLDETRRRLDKQSGENEAARRTLAETRGRLEAAKSAGEPDKLAALTAELAQRSRDVQKRDAEAADMRRRMTELEKQASSLTANIDAVKQDRDRSVAEARSETAAAQKRLDDLSAKLKGAEAELAQQGKRTSDRQAEVAALQRQLDDQRKAVAKDSGREAELAKQLAEREKALADERARAEKLNGEVGGLRGEVARLREPPKAAPAAVASAAPAIEILQPTVPATRSAGLPTVTVAAGDSGLVVGKVVAPGGLLAVTVNDVEVKPNEQGIFRATVPLAGDTTRVAIAAIDAGGRRSTSEFVLARPAAAGGARGSAPLTAAALTPDIKFGDYFALVIGNNEYKRLPKLKTAVKDAEDIAAILEKRYGYHVKLLRNADRYTILSALNEMREELTDTANLLIYYAGHGELDRVNNRGHWLPVDAEPNSTANWISNVQVTDVLNAMTARQIMVVADSCYSGTLTRSALAQLDAGMSPDTRLNWLKMMAAKRSRVVLSSGGVQPVLDGAGGEHSVFAKAFIDVLNANGGILEGQGLYQQVSERMTNVSLVVEVDQLPQYAPIKYAGHEAGDFFFVPTVN